MLITIFTPAYNRASLLPRLFESLCRQTYKDFEWVIVDDGSTDNTRDVVSQIVACCEEGFPIRYYYQENGGKYRAFNKGVNMATGSLFFTVDCDDWLPPHSLEKIYEQYVLIQADNKIAGVVGMKAYENGNRIGGEASFDPLVCSRFKFRYELKIKGDLAEVVKTSILKNFLFPEIMDEKFFPEQYLWYSIGKKYDFLFFNDIIYYAEYLSDGLTNNILPLRINNPVASIKTYYCSYYAPIPFFWKFRWASNYWRFYFHCSKGKRPKERVPLLFIPFGYLFYLKDKKQK